MPKRGHFILHTSVHAAAHGRRLSSRTQASPAAPPDAPHATHIRVTVAALHDAARPDPLDLPAGQRRGRLRRPAAADRAQAPHAAVGAQRAGGRRSPTHAVAGARRDRRGRRRAVAATPVAQCVTPGITLDRAERRRAAASTGGDRDRGHEGLPDQSRTCRCSRTCARSTSSDTELASGDDDGLLAVVMANRLPCSTRRTASRCATWPAWSTSRASSTRCRRRQPPLRPLRPWSRAGLAACSAGRGQDIDADRVVMGQVDVGEPFALRR